MSDDTDICEVLRRAEERECIFWTTDGDLAVSPTLFGAAADEIERLRAVLRMVRSDRPTAHSEAVWHAINEALAEQERSDSQENDR